MNTLKGTSLVGGSGIFEREKDDFYATDPSSTKALFEALNISGDTFYEPCVGQGHIAEVIKEYFPNAVVKGGDLVDRGYPDTQLGDYLLTNQENVDWVITNPPFKIAKEFTTKSLSHTNKGVAMFLKIQFLEGQARKDWFKDTPLKYVYVFSKRQQPWRNGESINPNTGKTWSNTMCFAWFVWEHGYIGEPTIRWI